MRRDGPQRRRPWLSRRLTIAVVSGVVLGCGLGTGWAAFSGTTSNGPNNFSVAAGDTTAPTIARATVAKSAAGSAAGIVRQGGTYLVYAEITDAVGVNTATANTSSFDTGVTAQSLATAGGPWTVSGLSYNYRSSGTLTANTGLTTGSTPAYTITATDAAANQAGPTSFNATIETYDSVITATGGLVSYWRLGEAATSTADDSVGSNDGTFTNAPTLGVTGALAGDSNKAVSFDGVNDYVVVPDAASLDLGDGPLTLEAWVRRNTVNTNGLSIFQKGPSAVQFGFFLDRTFLAKDNVGTVASSTTTIADTTTWHHVVATKSGPAAKLYIDGVDRSGTVTNHTLINTAAALYFASKGGTAEFLPARLDELAIYNQVLSAATVLDHYKAGAGTG